MTGSLGIHAQIAVARVIQAGIRLNRYITALGNGDIHWIFSWRELTFGQIARSAIVPHIGDGVAFGRGFQIFLEQNAFRLVSGGIHIGQIIGDNLHLAFHGHLPGERYVTCNFGHSCLIKSIVVSGRRGNSSIPSMHRSCQLSISIKSMSYMDRLVPRRAAVNFVASLARQKMPLAAGP